MDRPHLRFLPPLLLALAACAAPSDPPPEGEGATMTPVVTPIAATRPADRFFQRISMHCGQAFAGRVVADTPAPAGEDPFAGRTLVMHVRECGDDVIRVPFHVGEDRSRTWVLSRTDDGLRLKHDHRHEDGSEDALTMYGGDTVGSGSEGRQEFPVDAESRDLFDREGLAASTGNTWAMEIEPGEVFAYELSRRGRLFRVEFDLGQPVDAPPSPWGHGD